MTRPRIRTLKPEASRDEKIGRLSRDARLLFFTGLVSLADDEGRMRAMPSALIGDVFPYDDDITPAKVTRWLGEIEREQLILRYKVDSVEYLAIRHFKRHQQINRPRPSVLPPPPDHRIVTENAVNGHGTISETAVMDRGVVIDDARSHAQARVPLRSLPVVVGANDHVASRAPEPPKPPDLRGLDWQAKKDAKAEHEAQAVGYEVDVVAWAAHHFPDAHPSQAKATVDWMRGRGLAVTVDSVREFGEQNPMWALHTPAGDAA